MATFAAFGSFAMLLLVDFTGPMRDRLRAYLGLALVGAVFVCLGTFASSRPWLAAASMTCVAFAVLFVGVVSSELANATPALLLAFILPVSLNGSASQIPDRLAGWGLASMAALVAVTVLWPAPSRDSLREPATAACRALAARLRSDVAYLLGGADAPSETEHDKSIAKAETAITALHEAFLATPYRPTGLSTATRTVVRLVDEIGWLGAVIQTGPRRSTCRTVNRAGCAVKSAAATVLERGADLLAVTGGPADGLHEALGTASSRGCGDGASCGCQTRRPGVGQTGTATAEGEFGDFVSALDPTFRAQELAYAVSQIASNIDLTAAAERRSWLDRMLGRQPRGVAGTWRRPSSARRPTSSEARYGSTTACGVPSASAWPSLSPTCRACSTPSGSCSVPCRCCDPTRLSTGQNAAWGLVGYGGGFVAGAVLLVPVGSNTTIFWCLLPLAILVAGVLPAAISFTAGQAGFTVTLVILFNIIAPAGWSVGLLRVEDVALGCAVSLVVGCCSGPGAAAAALGHTLADAYRASARYLAEAVCVRDASLRDRTRRRCPDTHQPRQPPGGGGVAAPRRRLPQLPRRAGYQADLAR